MPSPKSRRNQKSGSYWKNSLGIRNSNFWEYDINKESDNNNNNNINNNNNDTRDYESQDDIKKQTRFKTKGKFTETMLFWFFITTLVVCSFGIVSYFVNKDKLSYQYNNNGNIHDSYNSNNVKINENKENNEENENILPHSYTTQLHKKQECVDQDCSINNKATATTTTTTTIRNDNNNVNNGVSTNINNNNNNNNNKNDNRFNNNDEIDHSDTLESEILISIIADYDVMLYIFVSMYTRELHIYFCIDFVSFCFVLCFVVFYVFL